MRERRAVRGIYGMKYRRKGHGDRNRHKNRIIRSEIAWFAYVKDINPQHPHPVKVSP